MVGSVTLAQGFGILLAIVLTLVAFGLAYIGIPLLLERWSEQPVSSVSDDDPDVTAASTADQSSTPLRHVDEALSGDLLPILLLLHELAAGKAPGSGKWEGGSQQGSCEHLHISEKGLSKGQWTELESWVRSGKQGFTQERWAIVMAKRPATIGEAVRSIEAKLAREQQQALEARLEPDFTPDPDAEAPGEYVPPLVFLAQQAAA